MTSPSTKKTSEPSSVFDEIIAHNAKYAETFGLGHLRTPPARKLAILTCMDSRMDLEQLLGLQVGDAHMIRNGGGLATDDALRSLILSTHLLGTRFIVIIQHTECGSLSVTDEQMRHRLTAQTGKDASHLQFHTFTDLDRTTTEQIKRVREHPFLPKDIQVKGFVYDVKKGSLREVHAD
ncbi:MAG: carbonic anhydrase [Acidobacteria bacterium]|nr:carbonic anhydrase [Acidobacteriota bacterium]MBS1867179.1 carbonic anhydrase [Acidobacteriota bacterium]